MVAVTKRFESGPINKNKLYVNTAELNIDGYHLFSNNLWEQNREIIIYVKQDLNCKQVFLNNSFMVYVLLEIQTDLNKGS